MLLGQPCTSCLGNTKTNLKMACVTCPGAHAFIPSRRLLPLRCFQVISEGMAVLRQLYPGAPDPVQSAFTRWAAEPLSRGAYRRVHGQQPAMCSSQPCMADARLTDTSNRCRCILSAGTPRVYTCPLLPTPCPPPAASLRWATPRTSRAPWRRRTAACCLRGRPPRTSPPLVSLDCFEMRGEVLLGCPL